MIKIIKFLKSIDITKLKSRADVSGWLLIIILSLDIHRFGAWYTGNQTHIRPYVFPFLCLAGIPIIVYVLAASVQYCVRQKKFTLLYFSGLYICSLPFSLLNIKALLCILKEPTWYDESIFRPVDLLFMKGIGLLFLTSAGIIAGLWIIGKIFRLISATLEMIKPLLPHNK